MGNIRDAMKKVANAFEDLTTLDVQTYTGTVDLSGNQEGFKGIKNLVKQAQTDAKISLVAESVYQFDGDSFNFITNGQGVPSEALKIHQGAVEAGLKTRQGLFELFKDLLDG
jgi:hypothetical protein